MACSRCRNGNVGIDIATPISRHGVNVGRKPILLATGAIPRPVTV
jgi:hypothetical protein